MLIKIGGDTLALDPDIRHQIETEAAKLAARFPEADIETQATIQEEFDPLHGHRIRCELSTKLAHGPQVIIRDARKNAQEAITQAFTAARRNLRRARGKPPLTRPPALQTATSSV
ncbi:MAG: Fis family transcriptional regulator [Sphingobacteriia bacterium]|nr:Fis family transcriptional regulator [Sphingobacteriia bacterium]NCC41320.1 Fis family transcriptional regulator [Gammaproteobacteria bacterium]